jgi:UDP-4-amino-4,6-dideoxy-N-acetyl-beta-L-altrosamine transaminase
VKIPYGRQEILEPDIDAVVNVLRSDLITQGAAVPEFENRISRYCGAAHAIAVCNATSALHIACLALGLGPGDLLWTTPITFVASANCALYCGADVDFVDIDPRTYNLSVDALEKKLRKASLAGKLPKVVVPVHLCGQSCDMAAIHRLGRQYGFRIIEDASHAIGGRYDGQAVGGCRYSDITVFSFHPVKIITTGEGGMALTNDDELAELMRRFRSHGIVTDGTGLTERPDAEIWNYQQVALGYNYRLTDIQAALGLSQMDRLDAYVTKRHQIAERYDRELASLPILTPFQAPNTYSSFHLYPVRLKSGKDARLQKRVYQKLRAAGVLVNLHYIPVYRQPYFEKLGFSQSYCSEAERYFHEAITLPMFPLLTDVEQGYVIHQVRQALS